MRSQAAATAASASAHPGRVSFDRKEIMGVLEQYSIGKIQSVREMVAGSSESPKAVIECDRGKLLLKRRAAGLEHGPLVGFAHEVIFGCLRAGVCVPPLIGTTGNNNSICQIVDKTYELFVFIAGTPFDQSVGHARQAGMLLGELHRAMDSITTSFEPTVESSVVNPQRANGFEFPEETQMRVQRILEYGLDAHRANARPTAIVHGDWHPGNMIFDGDEIVAICDFDNCRVGSRDRELAQALVYLSMKRPAGLPVAGEIQDIPPEASMERIVAVWEGYLEMAPSKPSPRLIGALMPAVLLDEALAGDPTVMRSSALVQAALTKAAWLDEKNPEIVRALETE